MMHFVRQNKNLEYTISPEDLEGIVKYVKQRNIEVKTVSEVLGLKCDKPGE